MKKNFMAATALIFLLAIIGATLWVFRGSIAVNNPIPAQTTEELPVVVTVHEDDVNIQVTPPQELDVIMVPEDRNDMTPQERCDHLGGEYQAIDHTCYHVDY